MSAPIEKPSAARRALSTSRRAPAPTTEGLFRGPAFAVGRLVPALVTLAIVAGAPLEARADAGAADALFKAGKELLSQGKVSEACAKFEASYGEDSALGALLNLANCREQEGRLAAAWARFGEAVEKAKKLGDDRAAYAQKRRDALSPRLPYLTIEVTNPVPGLTLYRGAQPLDAGAFGTALPIDPGETTLQVTEGDDVLWQQTTSLGEGQQATVKIDMKKIRDAAPAVKRKRGHDDPKLGGAAAAPTPYWGPQRVAGLVITSVGVVGVGAGLGLGGAALAKKSDVNANCVDANTKSSTRYCTPAGIDAASSARNLANAGQWLLVGSAAVAAVGLTVFFTAPSGSSASELDRRAWVVPIVSPTTAGIVTGGRF